MVQLGLNGPLGGLRTVVRSILCAGASALTLATIWLESALGPVYFILSLILVDIFSEHQLIGLGMEVFPFASALSSVDASDGHTLLPCYFLGII